MAESKSAPVAHLAGNWTRNPVQTAQEALAYRLPASQLYFPMVV